MQQWCLCPFKMNSLVHSVFFSSFFLFPSSCRCHHHHHHHHHTHLRFHSFFFKLWRCCIRFTVILNEQRERHSVYFFFSFSVAVGLWSLMKCTAHLCLLKSGVYVCLRLWVRALSVCVCVFELSPIQIKLESKWDIEKNQCPKKESSNSVCVCKFKP